MIEMCVCLTGYDLVFAGVVHCYENAFRIVWKSCLQLSQYPNIPSVTIQSIITVGNTEMSQPLF